MNDWSHDLRGALDANDPALMKAMLARVPRDVLQRAVPYIEELAKANARDGKFPEALSCYDQLLEVSPGNALWHAGRARAQGELHEAQGEKPQAIAAYRSALKFCPDDGDLQKRVVSLETEVRTAAILQKTLAPESGRSPAATPLPDVSVAASLFETPALPEGIDPNMRNGLVPHLRQYGNHQSIKNTLERLDDPTWLALWDQGLESTSGCNALLCGSELGTFALRALHHGAKRSVAVEAHPLPGRISAGVIQKHVLTAWSTAHGAAIRDWSEQKRRASIEEFAAHIEVVSPESGQLTAKAFSCLVFPDIDHSLLGTGIVRWIRKMREHLTSDVRILPGRARIFAMGIQWNYPGTGFDLRAVNPLRWSLSPQRLDLPATCWTALTETVQVGEIDFEEFSETTWNARFAVKAAGDLDAIVFWFELDIGAARLSNAPGSNLQCIRPAVQHVDPIALQAGTELCVEVAVTETRLHFRTQPPPHRARSHLLPSWYIPMIVDDARNQAYQRALTALPTGASRRTVLDIGAGLGLLSMLAARDPANETYACEISPSIAGVAREVLAQNGCAERIRLITKDCRNLTVPGDLPRRADVAVFELFDCSLIGEGVLHFLAYAREHLLASDARYLPMAAVVRAMVIEYRVDRVWDIDVNILNPFRFSQSFLNVDAGKLPHRALSEAFDVFAFDFSHATPAPEEKQIAVPACADGTAGAVLFWFDLQLDETTWLSNRPLSGSGLHWKQALQFLPEVRVKRGETLPLTAKHDGSSTQFRWKPDGLPKEQYSTLPRFDPRSFHQVAQLQAQTQSILQHCMSDPGEYSKVADFAARLAIDPGAHDIDPQIAQRFATMFFGS